MIPKVVFFQCLVIAVLLYVIASLYVAQQRSSLHATMYRDRNDKQEIAIRDLRQDILALKAENARLRELLEDHRRYAPSAPAGERLIVPMSAIPCLKSRSLLREWIEKQQEK